MSTSTAVHYKSKAEFQKLVPFEKRLEETTKLRKEKPGRVPIWLDYAACDSIQSDTLHHKFLMADTLTSAALMAHIRSKAELSSETGLFLLFDNTLASNVTLAQLYEEHKDSDGYLYAHLRGENVFG